MTDAAIDDIVHRHGKAIVSMDIGQIMNDLMPEAMMKLQQEAGGGTALQINDYELLGHTPGRRRLPLRRQVHRSAVLHRPRPLVQSRPRMEDHRRHHHRPRVTPRAGLLARQLLAGHITSTESAQGA